eukprot:3627106-Pyramimonas_sp.AAC.1
MAMLFMFPDAQTPDIDYFGPGDSGSVVYQPPNGVICRISWSLTILTLLILILLPLLPLLIPILILHVLILILATVAPQNA